MAILRSAYTLREQLRGPASCARLCFAVYARGWKREGLAVYERGITL